MGGPHAHRDLPEGAATAVWLALDAPQTLTGNACVIAKSFHGKRRRADIKPAISFHALRLTHGSMLATCAVPMAVIAEQLGHADRHERETLCASRST